MRKRSPCTRCGQECWSTKGTCKDCRKAAHVRVCDGCGGEFIRRRGTHCTAACAARSSGARRRAARGVAVTAKTRRVDLDYATPGLGHHARRRMLKKWKRQGRTCLYCAAPATTVDHLIPLVRGGTNYEGNLAPACRSCNSSKQDRLPIEFRLGKRASQTSMPRREKRPRPTKPERIVTLASCYICGATYTDGKGRRTCGGACAYEHTKRVARENYRAKAGLEPTWEVPTGQAWAHRRSA